MKSQGFWKFWSTLPGVITAIALLVGALASMFTAINHYTKSNKEKGASIRQISDKINFRNTHWILACDSCNNMRIHLRANNFFGYKSSDPEEPYIYPENNTWLVEDDKLRLFMVGMNKKYIITFAITNDSVLKGSSEAWGTVEMIKINQ